MKEYAIILGHTIKHMRSSMIRFLAVLLGIIFFALAAVYYFVPAGSLPSFVPGYLPGASTIHVKHAIAALFLGLITFAYVWFATGKKD
jgi:hypothetical protein